ncbi:Spindle pole body component alp14 [Sphaceloma murrayae]|uniref:Spindle pole body component alp14 n=1 Tax=Sphaceloma murrayae TaxID=2082308 RepID=A0A2K1QN47_9PEZI|nr:Spindle pole body component alp14 [Sphaceloma murrayae]
MAEEEDFSKLPLTDRWTHKVWKVRKEAYEEAAKEFKTAQESDGIVRDFVSDSSLWKGAAADSNVAAQQEGLAALCAFLEIAGAPGCKRTRNETITPIVEKGLTGRPAAKASALEALMLYVELDKPDPVIEELIPLLSHKQPKVIAATLSALTALFHAYGCKTIEPKPVIKQLPKVYGHADKNVRAEAQNLTVEMYRWLKDAMKPLFWGELKPVQQTDLEKLFEKVKDEPPAKQERLLRSQQIIEETRAAAGGGEDDVPADDAEEPEIDLEPEYMAVDVFAKVPKDLEERLASSKWKDRKEVLDELYAAVNVPAMEDGPFDTIIRGCAKSMKDANIQVVQVAANSVECIAKGLRKKFAKYRNMILAPMLERFKEKKQSVTDALAGACDAVFLACGLSDILEETLEFLKHKNPLVKLESTKFLTRSLKTTKEAPQLPEVKVIADAAKALLSDSQEPTRNASAECLGVLWRIMTDRNMLNHLEGVDDIRKAKIKEYCDSAEVRAKWKPKAAPPPAKAAAPASKKPAPTRRPAGGAVKKAAPVRAPSPVDEPLAARPTARPAAKPATSRGLTAPGLKKPGLTRPGSLASPARPKQAPVYDDPIPAPRGLPTPSRSLAARPLSKPSTASPPASPRGVPQQSALSSAERAELADLRAETELLRNQNADLRTDKMRLQSQIHELQNQNAQLIEDHTRDVLSVKAKETQLVRARSDLEEAEERVHALGREVERLKRQLGVSGSGDGAGPGMNGYANGYHHHPHNHHQRVKSPVEDNGEEGKENSLPRELMLPQRLKSAAGSTAPDGARIKSPTLEDGGGRQSPAGFTRPTARPLSGFAQQQQQQQREGSGASRTGGLSRSGGSGTYAGQTGEGQESWRRAAEVTQNLKARIELMK